MIILCDVDGVLADFTGAACRELSEIIGRAVTPSECSHWDMAYSLGLTGKQAVAFEARVRRKGFCAGLAILPGALSGVAQLQNTGFVYFVTVPWRGSRYWLFERTQWLADNLGISATQVIHTYDKAIVRGDVIIDDKPAHVVGGERKLRVLVPNASNAAFRKEHYGELLVAKSWPKILAAVRGVK